MEAHNLPTDFYKCIDRKNWSIDVIRRGLQIDDVLYTTIYTTMELELESRNILGSKLNNIGTKRALQLMFTKIQQSFPAVFENIPATWREKCLVALAQKCNYNKRRRLTRSRSPRPLADGTYTNTPKSLPSPSRLESQYQSTHTRSLETITVLIRRVEGGQSTICRMQDFIQEGPNNNISIDNLAFGQFVTVLQEDIKFDSSRDAISYSCAGDITVPIANERSWKAAMGEMYTRGLDRFMFNIEESEYSYMPRHSCTHTEMNKVKP